MSHRSGHDLFARLELDERSCVALIGAGGKTTTMMALAKQLASAEFRTVITTTTKIWPPAGVPVVLASGSPNLAGALRKSLTGSLLVAVGGRLNERGKLTAIDPADVCVLVEEEVGVVLVEADGAAGRSLKSHGPHEPVVPACASHVLLLAGMDSCEKNVDSDTVHRLDPFLQCTGARLGERMSPHYVVRALEAALPHVPPRARAVVILNKVDTPLRLEAAEHVARLWRARYPDVPVLRTERGELVGTVDGGRT
jgi:molybdenum cofactor cytidylyltransferase